MTKQMDELLLVIISFILVIVDFLLLLRGQGKIDEVFVHDDFIPI